MRANRAQTKFPVLSKTVDKLVPAPVLNGIPLALVGVGLGSLGKSASVAGFSIPVPVGDFAVGAAASAVANVATDDVLPEVTKDEKVQLFEAKVANPVAAGAALVALRSALLSSDFIGMSLVMTFGVGAGAELSALCRYDILKSMLHTK